MNTRERLFNETLPNKLGNVLWDQFEKLCTDFVQEHSAEADPNDLETLMSGVVHCLCAGNRIKIRLSKPSGKMEQPDR